MDYNQSIPNIYDSTEIKSNDDIKIDILEYNLKSNEIIKIYPKKYTFLYFETEYNKIFLNEKRIYNRDVLFYDTQINTQYYLNNLSDYNSYIKIYGVKYSDIEQQINHGGHEHINIYEFNNNIRLCTHYYYTIILYKIIIKTKKECTNNIISLQNFNIIIYYKLKLISDNTYELTLCGIKNLFVDQFLEIDIMCNNIYEIYPKYCKMLNQIYKFMNENINHINKNKIHAPLVADPDGWKCNLFYDLHTKDFIKKYDICNFDIYYCRFG